MTLSKSERKQVREMFDGRCAYCGQVLGEKWHADHVLPVERKLEFVRDQKTHSTRMRATGEMWRPERNHIKNIMPACAPCNIRKGVESIEEFRRSIERSIEVMRNNHPTYRHALRFGLITEHPSSIVFYFEKNAAEVGERMSEGKDD